MPCLNQHLPVRSRCLGLHSGSVANAPQKWTQQVHPGEVRHGELHPSFLGQSPSWQSRAGRSGSGSREEAQQDAGCEPRSPSARDRASGPSSPGSHRKGSRGKLGSLSLPLTLLPKGAEAVAADFLGI